MNRRDWLHTVGVGSAAFLASGRTLVADMAEQGHAHKPVNGPLSSVTVAFGQWPVGSVTAPVDRMALPTAPPAPNGHLVIPHTATIKAGGTINYVIAGFHQLAVYAPGKQPTDVNTSTLLPIAGAPPFIGLIDDPAGRLFRSLDPRLNPANQDRVEVVTFGEPGLYLVICTVSIHFINDHMFGWVRVLP